MQTKTVILAGGAGVVGRQVAAILNGQAPGDLPVENAAGFAIVFNLARARELGITIPLALLTAADIVYKD